MELSCHDILFQMYSQECYTNIKPIIEQINFKYAVIKGEALSKQAYGNNGKRKMSDIDFLVPRSELSSFEALLEQNGFKITSDSRINKIAMISSSHQSIPWSKDIYPWGKMTIDLNFDIFWGEYEGKRLSIEKFLCDTVEMNIYGITVKTLTPLKAIIQLILHHYKDMNSIFLLTTRNSITHKMFEDVYFLLINNLNTITIDSLYLISLEYGIIPYVFYILYYTGQVYKDKNLSQFIEAFKTPEGENLLNCYGLNSTERKEWKCDFSTRLNSNNILSLIKEDLSFNDIQKIEINKQIF